MTFPKLPVSWQRIKLTFRALVLTPLLLLITGGVEIGPGINIWMQYASAQSIGITEAEQEFLHEVMPGADNFSIKEGQPPVFKAYENTGAGEEQTLIGYVFMTADFPPEEVGYSAPIEVLVGMNLQGVLTGIKVLYYTESYKSIRGDFLASRRFLMQFKNKEFSHGFRVGRDIDGVSRATITSWAMSRGIRNASRSVAKAYLRTQQDFNSQNWAANALAHLGALTWEELVSNGFISETTINMGDESQLQLTFAYIGTEELGEMMLGPGFYSRTERAASGRTQDGKLMLVGVDGNASIPFRQERLAIQQGDKIYPISRRQFIYVGRADQGKIVGHVRYSGAMIMDEAIDITQPLTILYNVGQQMGDFSNVFTIDYALPTAALALLQGLPFPVPDESVEFGSEQLIFETESVFSEVIGAAPWEEVAALLILLVLVMFAFVRKSSKMRWIALTCTLLYLGFFDGGFLSVSHIISGFKVGPSLFLNDLPLLLIVVFTLVTTLLWGRIFCSSLCPFGALQDILTRIVPRRLQRKVPQLIHDRALYIKYAILALILIMAAVQSDLSIFQYFEPFGTLFFFSPSVVLWVILIGFVLASSVIKRFYCRYACPLGAALGVVSLISPFRIKRIAQCDICTVCEHACPTAAIRGPKIDFKECVRCDICEIKLIARSGVCKHDMDVVRSRLKHWQPVSVT